MLWRVRQSIRRTAKWEKRKIKGFLDYFRNPSRGAGWGGPFNGQKHRRAIFDAILKLGPAAIIETGTYRGTTTEYFAKTGLPVFSIEAAPGNYGFSKARLLRFWNVSLRPGDSRQVLPKILTRLGAAFRQRPIIFYLDAHWFEDLPLARELEIILRFCSEPIIMIDDFQVPDDAGYGFDDYGPGKALVRDYIEPFLQGGGLHLFYPSVRSSQETGVVRGCAVLVREETRERLQSVTELRLAA